MRRIFESPRAPWLVLLLTFCVTLSSIRLGFYNDDHAWKAALGGNWPEGPAWWDLYRFADPSINPALREIGVLPWWTTLELRLHFLRPLASALLRLDFALFGRAPLGYHLHCIAWYLALVASVGMLLRTLLPRVTANLAMLVYAFSVAHFYPWAWISCQHMLVASVPCVLGITAFVRSERAGHWLYALGFLVGLSASETALGSLAFPLAYVAFRRSSARKLIPAGVVAVLYLVVYRIAGAGASHGDGYVDPLHSPGAFALRALGYPPMLMGNAFFGVPIELLLLTGWTPVVVVGLLACLLVGWLWRATRERMESSENAALPWLVIAGIVGCVPSLGAFPGGRVLLLPNIGFAALLAVLLGRGFAGAGMGRRIGLGFLAFVHLFASPLVNVGNAFFNGGIGRELERIAATADFGSARPRAFVMGTSDPMVTMYVPAVLADTGRSRLSCWSVMSGAKQSHRMTRIGERELVLRPNSGAFAREPFETLFRAMNVPFRVGEESQQCGVRYRVTALDADARPTEVHVFFDRPLEDPSLRFLVWRDGSLVVAPMPKPGETIDVPWSPGPLGNF